MDGKRLFVKLLLGYTIIVSTAVFIITRFGTPAVRAMLSMAMGLLLLWIVILGGITYYFRDGIKRFVQLIPLPPWLKFLAMFLGMGLIEEAITTSMTNLAPFFGSRMGEAYITASANYLDVILYHSIFMFFPMMIGWTILLSRYDFSSFDAFVCWGLTGLLMELAFSGIGQIGAFGFWMFVYGLMIWLPAYCLPKRELRPVRFYHYALLFIFPFLCFVAMMLLFLVLGMIFPNSYFYAVHHHTKLHFGPIV